VLGLRFRVQGIDRDGGSRIRDLGFGVRGLTSSRSDSLIDFIVPTVASRLSCSRGTKSTEIELEHQSDLGTYQNLSIYDI